MNDSVTLAERDLALVEALQVAPRAPWSAVARATAMSPVTAARRWQRLVDAGAAWVTGAPGVSVWNAQCLAYVEMTCAPGTTLAVAHTLAHDSHAVSVEVTAGGADLFATVAAADLASLSEYILSRIDVIPGVTSSRTRIATRFYRDGSGWRLGALSHQAISGLHPTQDKAPWGAAPASLLPGDRELLVQLGLDGRSAFATLAAAASVSEATARRRTARLLGTGAVLLRAEVAARLAGWSVTVILSIDAPTQRLEETAQAISRLRQVRLCATVAGTPPIVVAAWLHGVEEIHRFEMSLAKALPGLAVVDRIVTLRAVKRMGRLLNEDGRSVGAVPMDVWAHPKIPSNPVLTSPG